MSQTLWTMTEPPEERGCPTVSGHPRTPGWAAEHQLGVFWCGLCQAMPLEQAVQRGWEAAWRGDVSQDGCKQGPVLFGVKGWVRATCSPVPCKEWKK